MGNEASRPSATNRLLDVIPPVWEHWGKEGKGFKVFNSDGDRKQFVQSVLSVISNNGELPVDEYDFRLLFSRNSKDQMIATLVATRAGIITAKIEPPEGGSEHAEAFKAFQRHVELRLHDLLQTIPDAAQAIGIAKGRGSSSAVMRNSSTDDPPSYVYVESASNRTKESAGKK